MIDFKYVLCTYAIRIIRWYMFIKEYLAIKLFSSKPIEIVAPIYNDKTGEITYEAIILQDQPELSRVLFPGTEYLYEPIRAKCRAFGKQIHIGQAVRDFDGIRYTIGQRNGLFYLMIGCANHSGEASGFTKTC
jgi:hypothetical protein